MWDRIIGQERQIEQLRRALAAGRLPNAYLFTGPAGIGKRLAANTLAAAICCPSSPDNDGAPCGNCPACHKAASGNHPDLFFLEPESSESGVVQTIKIGPLRELSGRLQLHPLEAPAKLAVIDGAEKMSPEGENSILKILEEPPPLTHFILITPFPQRLLPTIRSRCRQVAFSPIPEPLLCAELQRRLQIPQQEAGRIARLSGGSMGAALALTPEFVGEVLDRFLPLTAKASSADIIATAESWKALDAAQIPLLLDILASFYRDVLRCQCTGEESGLIHPEAARSAALLPPERVIGCLAKIGQARSAAESAANKQLMFEQLLFTVAG